MRLGLLGGSFNPIHNCHLSVAAQTRDALNLDRILFVPTGDPPHKDSGSLAPARHREAMVRLAIGAEPSFELTDIELRRGGKSYSIDTIRALQTHLGPEAELFFVIGLDAFLDLPSWKEADRLLRACHFVVVSRPGASFERLATMPLFPPVDREQLRTLDRGEAHRLTVPVPDGDRLTLLRLAPCLVSASEIRQRIRARRSVADVLPPPVQSYIIQHGLYLEDADHTGSQG
ncbi:MAG TPA: nicotinate-nucleotide adenylyltransferase [Nitrospiraceae bacterium]|nr:nicotinate-nucleotide adenylyltransferase [Nitrospiraceae bacterium]